MKLYLNYTKNLHNGEHVFDKLISHLDKEHGSFYTTVENNNSSIDVDNEEFESIVNDDMLIFDLGGSVVCFNRSEININNKYFLKFALNGKKLKEITAEPCKKCGELIYGKAYKNPVYPYKEFICCSCMKEYDETAVKQYTFKPQPQFFGESSTGFYVGAEIEIYVSNRGFDEDDDDDTEYKSYVQKKAMEITKLSNGFVYCKSDSSIGGGYEIVTHPFTIANEKRTGRLKTIFDKLSEDNSQKAGRDDKITSCGVHLHVSKKAINKTTRTNIIDFFVKNENYIKEISHRTNFSNTIDNYAKIYELRKESEVNSILNDEMYGNSSHYSAIHATENTIEFRIFNSTRNYEEFMSYVEFVYGIIEYCSKYDDADVNKFKKYMRKYENFTTQNGGKVCA